MLCYLLHHLLHYPLSQQLNPQGLVALHLVLPPVREFTVKIQYKIKRGIANDYITLWIMLGHSFSIKQLLIFHAAFFT